MKKVNHYKRKSTSGPLTKHVKAQMTHKPPKAKSSVSWSKGVFK